MILENRPDEIPRLKRYESFFEAVTWAVITSAYALSWLMPDEAVNLFLINSIVLVATASAIVFYRILPFEKRTGSFIFTFRLKAFIIGILNIIMISVFILGTGGIKSPFWYLYLLSPLGNSHTNNLGSYSLFNNDLLYISVLGYSLLYNRFSGFDFYNGYSCFFRGHTCLFSS